MQVNEIITALESLQTHYESWGVTEKIRAYLVENGQAVTELEHAKLRLETEIAELRNRHQACALTLSEFERHRDALETQRVALQSAMAAQKTETDRLVAEAASKAEELAGLETRLHNVAGEIERLEALRAESQTRAAECEAAHLNSEQRLGEAMTQLEALVAQRDTIIRELEAADASLTEKRTAAEIAARELAEVNDRREQMAWHEVETAQAIADLQARRAALVEEIAKLDQRREQTASAATAAERAVMDLELCQSELANEVSGLQARRDSIAEAVAAEEAAEKQIARRRLAVEAEFTLRIARLGDIEAKLSEAEAGIAALAERKAALDEETARLECAVSDGQEQKGALEAEVVRLSACREKLATNTAEAQRAERAVAELTTRERELKNVLGVQEKRHADLTQEVMKYDQRLADARAQYTEMAQQLIAMQKEREQLVGAMAAAEHAAQVRAAQIEQEARTKAERATEELRRAEQAKRETYELLSRLLQQLKPDSAIEEKAPAARPAGLRVLA